MNVLMRCCVRSLKENRKRTTVTIVGVILSAALITGVACLAESMRQSIISYAKQSSGDYHYSFSGVKGENLKYFTNNANIEKISLAKEVGYALLEDCVNPDKPYLYIKAADTDGLHAMALTLTEGRLPEREDELVIGRHILYNGMLDFNVGDTITLKVGNRMSGGTILNQNTGYLNEGEILADLFERTYTIVGIVERPNYNIEPWTSPGYSAFTYMQADGKALVESENYEVFVTYTSQALKNAAQVTAGLLGVSDELYQRYSRNNKLSEQEQGQITQIASFVQKKMI